MEPGDFRNKPPPPKGRKKGKRAAAQAPQKILGKASVKAREGTPESEGVRDLDVRRWEQTGCRRSSTSVSTTWTAVGHEGA